MDSKKPNNVIAFRPRQNSAGHSNQRLSSAGLDSSALKLLRVSDEIDALILKHVESGDIELRELAGLLAHRLGALMYHLEDKGALFPVCMNVAKKQAKVD